MNISTIAQMIKDDASITEDVPKFLAKMNLKDINQIVSRVVVKEENTILTSIAEMNGGPATEKDVLNAIDFIAAQDLRIEADKRFSKVSGAITGGTVKNSFEMISKFSENG